MKCCRFRTKCSHLLLCSKCGILAQSTRSTRMWGHARVCLLTLLDGRDSWGPSSRPPRSAAPPGSALWFVGPSGKQKWGLLCSKSTRGCTRRSQLCCFPPTRPAPNVIPLGVCCMLGPGRGGGCVHVIEPAAPPCSEVFLPVQLQMEKLGLRELV